MRKPSLIFGALLGGVTSLALMALLYLGEQFAGLPFVPFDLFDWLARALPGNVITMGIDAIVGIIRTFNLGPTSETAKSIEQLMALGLGLAGGIVLGLLIAWVLRHSTRPAGQVGAVIGLVAFLPIAALEWVMGLSGNPVLALLWLGLLFAGWGALLGHLLGGPLVAVTAEQQTARRAALAKIVGGSAAVALGAWGLGRLLAEQEAATGAGQPLSSLLTATPEMSPVPVDTATPTHTPTATPTASPTAGAAAEAAASPTAVGAAATPTPTPRPTATPLPTPTAAATMRDRVAAAPGTRMELTPNENFYRIDINTRPVVIDGDTWMLQIEGLFDEPRALTLPDLLAYPPVTQPITLSCISNPVAGDLISTSNWTGLRLRDLVKDMGLRPEAKELSIEAADGFYESVAMEDIMDPRTLLVYGMNGETLPVEHGFPLRIYIPDRYGMKQPKWITRITAIDKEGPGYWVDRGWNAEARPQIVSVIDTVAEDSAADDQVPIGGIAWAGDRGIQKVEVQVDGGEWVEAVLRTPPLSPLTWVQWRYDWPAAPGQHTFRVRAIDGTGALQIEDVQDVHPDGATGYHAVTEQI